MQKSINPPRLKVKIGSVHRKYYVGQFIRDWTREQEEKLILTRRLLMQYLHGICRFTSGCDAAQLIMQFLANSSLRRSTREQLVVWQKSDPTKKCSLPQKTSSFAFPTDQEKDESVSSDILDKYHKSDFYTRERLPQFTSSPRKSRALRRAKSDRSPRSNTPRSTRKHFGQRARTLYIPYSPSPSPSSSSCEIGQPWPTYTSENDFGEVESDDEDDTLESEDESLDLDLESEEETVQPADGPVVYPTSGSLRSFSLSHLPDFETHE